MSRQKVNIIRRDVGDILLEFSVEGKNKRYIEYIDGELYFNSVQITGDANYRYFVDSGTRWRTGVRENSFVTDKTLTDLGFDGIEGTDWRNITEL
jgi:hypothetical protein